MISVVIPVYNKSHTINETLKTVVAQNFKKFEVILVNDGSTDNSVEVMNKYMLDSRFKIFSQTNQGVSIARNRGVLESKYDYIAFLDGDDEWLPNYLERMAETIEKFPDFVMYNCAGIVVNADKRKFLRLNSHYKNKISEINFLKNPGVYLHTSATIINKSIFNKIGGFPKGMKRNEDLALFYSMAFYGSVAYCGFPLSIYNGGVAGQATQTAFHSVVDYVAKRYNFVHKQYLTSKSINKDYVIFTKYEYRHTLISCLRKSDYLSIKTLYENTNCDLLKLFNSFEKRLIKNSKYRKMAIFYILSTKVRWLLRGYPRAKWRVL
jgi:glycosyltransferase involved in cell wall biosynthesis